MIDALAITIWRWADAPSDLRALSGYGGGEQWVALVPVAYTEENFMGLLFHIDAAHDPQIVSHPSLSEYQVWIGGSHA